MTSCTLCERDAAETLRVNVAGERHHACARCLAALRSTLSKLRTQARRNLAIRAAVDDAKLFYEFGASMRRAAQLASYYHRTDCKPVLQALKSYFARQQGRGRGNRKIAA